MRIVCLIESMDAGGAERVMSRIVSFLAGRHEVMLLTWEAPGVPSFYSVPSSVRFVQVDLMGGSGPIRLRRIVSRVTTLRRQLREFRPDVVLSFMDTTNLVALFACVGMRVGIVVSERIDPAGNRNGRGIDVARRLLYPLAHRTVVQTARVATYFPRAMQRRISIIGNPIEPASASALPGVPGPEGRFRIVSLGRLEYQKGLDLVIDAFARIAERNQNWDLVIFGEGQERESLARQARERGVAARVYFAGVTREPHRELAASHVMAFPSRYEGFPNALGEAQAAGLPAVGYAGVSGVEELIVDGVTGFLVSPDGGSAAFASALERLVQDAELRERMGSAASTHVRRWASETILAEWEHLLEAVADIPQPDA